MKSLKLGDTIWADGYKATAYSLPNMDGDMQIILDEGLLTETVYDCNIHDITLDSDGDFVLDTEFVPVVGDVIRINDEEHELIAIDDNIVTIQSGDEISYYSIHDLNCDIINGFWISTLSKQVFSPTVKRKLKVYEAQDSVYLYNSLGELKEIYELLGEPSIQGFYGTDSYENLTDSLQYEYGILHYWEDYDSDYDYTYKYIKVIQGAYIKDEL